MKDVFIGLIIAIVVFFLVDFIYTEKNTCLASTCVNCPETEEKCGIIKKLLDIDIYLFDRFW